MHYVCRATPNTFPAQVKVNVTSTISQAMSGQGMYRKPDVSAELVNMLKVDSEESFWAILNRQHVELKQAYINAVDNVFFRGQELYRTRSIVASLYNANLDAAMIRLVIRTRQEYKAQSTL